MKNLKKVLACLLVAAMTLTCFVGALTVSADGTGTIVAGNVEVADDATSVVVPVTINADAALNAAKITVSTSQGWVVDAITVADGAAYIDEADVNGGTFLIQANDNVAGFATATVNVAMTSKVACEADVIITLDEVHAATWGEEVVNLAITNGKITVKASVVEPVLDSSLTLMQTAASIQDSLGVSYIIMNNKFNTKYASVAMEVTAKKYNTDRNVETQAPVEIPFTQLNAALSTATYSGIAMFEIDLEITARIKAYDADGNFVAYSANVVASPVSLLKTLYSNNSKNPKTLTLITDMFNLGTAAQKYFAKEGSDLANATAINDGWDQTYASTATPELNTVNKVTWDANSPLTSSQLMFIPSVNMAATPTLSYVCMDRANKFTAADLRIEVSYTAVLPAAFAGFKPETIDTFVSTGVNEVATYGGMTLADGNQIVTAKLYYKDQLVLTSEFTMDQGVANLIKNGDSFGLPSALAKFQASARAYFS